jgi:hypothetical protein
MIPVVSFAAIPTACPPETTHQMAR